MRTAWTIIRALGVWLCIVIAAVELVTGHPHHAAAWAAAALALQAHLKIEERREN